MSLSDRDLPVGAAGRLDRLLSAVELHDLLRGGALLSALVVIASFTLVMRDIVGTVGDPTRLTTVVIGAILVGTLTWRLVTLRHALGLGAIGLVVASLWYYLLVPFTPQPWLLVQGTAELLTGRSALWIVRIELWALLFAPIPAFLTWVLALDGRYVQATAVGGGTLCFFVLTGDAGLTVTVLGVAAAAALVGLGDVMRRADSVVTVERLVIVLGIMVVTPFLVSVVPGGTAGPLSLVGDGATTMEENVVGSDGSLEIVGSVDQDPEIRFLASGDQPRYWRTGSYDRYTGDGWVRSGEPEPFDEDALAPPAEHTQTTTYEMTAQTSMNALPAPWQPVGVEGIEDRAAIAPDGTPTLESPLESGETVEVTVARPDASAAELAAAEGSSPESVVERYTQMPASTPDRVAERTRNVAANAETPYETAAVVEEWLRTNRGYSLDVERPEGDIVDAFLFEMEKGYCTYHATAMVGMLRSVDIPTRLAVGYSPGESFDDETWAVRGANSHAWVEVYIPEYGWVQFDPTPPDPRSDAEAAAVSGPGGSADVTAADSDDGTDDIEPGDSVEAVPEEELEADPEFGSEPGFENDTDGPPGEEAFLETVGDDETEEPDEGREEVGEAGADSGLSVSPGEIDPSDGGDALLSLPAYQQLLVGLLAVAGLAAGVRRSPVPGVVGREYRIRFQRRRDPETDIETAHDRLLLVLARRHRPRDPGETTRQYLDAVDACPEARRLAAIRERARFAGDSSAEAADEAVELVEAVREG